MRFTRNFNFYHLNRLKMYVCFALIEKISFDIKKKVFLFPNVYNVKISKKKVKELEIIKL